MSINHFAGFTLLCQVFFVFFRLKVEIFCDRIDLYIPGSEYGRDNFGVLIRKGNETLPDSVFRERIVVSKMNNTMYDVAVIGAGVTGSAIARELARYQAKICVLEKGEDVCTGTSKANSAIVHGGFDAVTGSLKAILKSSFHPIIVSSVPR